MRMVCVKTAEVQAGHKNGTLELYDRQTGGKMNLCKSCAKKKKCKMVKFGVVYKCPDYKESHDYRTDKKNSK